MIITQLLSAGIPIIQDESSEESGMYSFAHMTPEQEEIKNRILFGWTHIREKRDKLIQDSMWIFQRHQQETEMIALGICDTTTLTDDKIIAMHLYIQALRDIPQTFHDPLQVIFPTAPT